MIDTQPLASWLIACGALCVLLPLPLWLALLLSVSGLLLYILPTLNRSDILILVIVIVTTAAFTLNKVWAPQTSTAGYLTVSVIGWVLLTTSLCAIAARYINADK